MAAPSSDKFPKWLFRECCTAIVEVPKRYKDLEHFTCKCGKKVPGERLKYFDTKEAAEKAKAAKSSMDGMPDLGQIAGM